MDKLEAIKFLDGVIDKALSIQERLIKNILTEPADWQQEID